MKLALWSPKRSRLYLLLVFVGATLAAGSVWFAHNALAATCSPTTRIAYGRDCWHGYFGNGFDDGVSPPGLAVLSPYTSGGPAIPWTISNANPNSARDFINLITNYLNTGSTQDMSGAEFIVETMLGYDGGTHSRSCAHPGNQCYTDWVQLVKEYDKAGLVDWSHTSLFPCQMENSYYQQRTHDDAFFYDGDDGCGSTVDSVVFWDKTHTQILYAIKRTCANPLGKIQGLPKLDYHLTASLSPGSATPAFTSGLGTGIVQPGMTYHLTPQVSDPTNVDTDPFYMEIENLTSAYSLNAGITSPGGQDTAHQFRTGTCQSSATQCWHWTYGNGLGAKSTSMQTDGALFTVSAGAPQGSQVCYRLEVSPSNQNGATLDVPSVTGSSCFLVYTPVYPSVVGNAGDVHAGGGLCGATLSSPTSGAIDGNPNSNSLDQYVVSASAGVKNFGSNNSSSGSGVSNLTLGSVPPHGYYAQICRPDLFNGVAKPAINNGVVGYCTVVGSIDLSALPAGCNSIDVFVSNGGLLHMKQSGGPLQRKITVVSFGSVQIDNDIMVSGTSVDRKTVPSLGVIASGDITIDKSVTNLDAYLFADGVIDTCLQANANVTEAQCLTPTLNINGFVMAQQLLFHRLGILNAPGGSYPAENVTLTSAVYLNPPEFFDNSADTPDLNGLGERQPLF